MFDYVALEGKAGPLILLDHQNLVIDQGALRVTASKGEMLPVAPGPTPSWIEIDGIKFLRR